MKKLVKILLLFFFPLNLIKKNKKNKNLTILRKGEKKIQIISRNSNYV